MHHFCIVFSVPWCILYIFLRAKKDQLEDAKSTEEGEMAAEQEE